MDFIDRHRFDVGITLGASLHPRRIAPVIAFKIRDHAGGAKVMLGIEAKGIRLYQNLSLRAAKLEFVMLSNHHSRYKNFPDPGTSQSAHHVPSSIPAVEVSHHADALGIRSPDGKGRAGDPIDTPRMSAEHAIGLVVLSLTEEMKVKIPHKRRKGIGIAVVKNIPIRKRRLDLVGIRRGRQLSRHRSLE